MPKSDNGTHGIAASFIIVGFETLREVELFLFSLFSSMYVLTIGANFLVVILVAVDHHLHKPMYILLANFSLLEVLYTTVTIPIMLNALFCFPNFIDHFFCDYAPLLKLSCEDTSEGEFIFMVMSWSVILGCFLLIMISYTFIVLAVLKIPSTEGQKKAFNTCASHLAVVSIFYGTVIFMYIRPTSHIRFTMDKVISVFYCVVTPLMNPVIYCLRNQEVKVAFMKILQMLGKYDNKVMLKAHMEERFSKKNLF
ncbi:hypothetical protein AB205_0208670 [Aquarana catesbeiana]|uniref:G-protein coupled receptors family 1 profile domain-containing protein n=1 Tax=Aquarana catesbeiana TaxID=8400 RepID=A0A2G9RGS2_AQUCT|nr:hypothetical protein AB205_0208670 [Aquarana catesbeiana]